MSYTSVDWEGEQGRTSPERKVTYLHRDRRWSHTSVWLKVRCSIVSSLPFFPHDLKEHRDSSCRHLLADPRLWK